MRHIVWTACAAALAWASIYIWRGPYFGMLAFLFSALLIVRWVSDRAAGWMDGGVCAVFFTLPFPYHAEILSLLQILTLRVSLWVSAAIGHPLTNEGSLIYLSDGPVRIAAACSGFQSLVVLVALAGMFGHLTKMSVARKALMLILAATMAIGFNILRVSAMLMVGDQWGLSTAMNFWHGLSGWLFYSLALGSMAALGFRLKKTN